MPKERGDTGQFVETVGSDEILTVFDQVDGPPVVTSADVADMTGLSRDSARRKLEELNQQGTVESRRTAGRVLYWRTESSPSVRPEKTTHAPDSPSKGPDESADSSEESQNQPPSKSVRSESPASLAEVEFPSGRDRVECEAAVHAAHDYLQNHGPASMRELVLEVMPNHPVGYDVPQLEPGDRYRGAWWRRVVKPGLQALPDVQSPSRGASDWRYVGD